MERDRQTDREIQSRKGSRKKKSIAQRLASCLSAAGTFLLILLVLSCLPLTLPKLFGYHIYSVVSGSMEPAIPTGSLVYIGETDPGNVEEGEIIAFYGAGDSASIITHRVVENRPMMGVLITKGDANPAEDISPVPYENFIGKVARTVPGAGRAAELLTSTEGKALAGGVIAAAVFLQILSTVVGAGKHDNRR